MERTYEISVPRLVLIYYQFDSALSRDYREEAETIKKQSKKLKFLLHLHLRGDSVFAQ